MFAICWECCFRLDGSSVTPTENKKVDFTKGKIKCDSNGWATCMSIVNTMWCRYNAVNFIPNSCKRHPIARPLGWGMECLLWIQSNLYSAPAPAVMYAIICYIGPHYKGTWLYFDLNLRKTNHIIFSTWSLNKMDDILQIIFWIIFGWQLVCMCTINEMSLKCAPECLTDNESKLVHVTKPSCNKPLTEPMLTRSYGITRPQRVKTLWMWATEYYRQTGVTPVLC